MSLPRPKRYTSIPQLNADWVPTDPCILESVSGSTPSILNLFVHDGRKPGCLAPGADCPYSNARAGSSIRVPDHMGFFRVAWSWRHPSLYPLWCVLLRSDLLISFVPRCGIDYDPCIRAPVLEWLQNMFNLAPVLLPEFLFLGSRGLIGPANQNGWFKFLLVQIGLYRISSWR